MAAGLAVIAREWGRIGCIGFGGPPTHIALTRELCVERNDWMDDREFEDAVATCNLLPGPSSTQLAIFCAWRVGGRAGALVGGAAFILPGLVVILGLAAVFLGSPPDWVRGAGAGAGAAVAAVAVQAGSGFLPASWRRAGETSRARWVVYFALGFASPAAVGPWLVLVLLGCGLAELMVQRGLPRALSVAPIAAAAVASGGLLAVAWVGLKVGALSYGGGFVVIPLMQADAVDHHHWMTAGEFLNAVALGQVTPGPVTHTVAVVGYAASGVGAALLASAFAFAPSFAFVLIGGHHFDRLRRDPSARAFLDGAGPAAVGAILGSAIPLAQALTETWQYVVLGASAVLLLALRRGIVLTLLCAAAAGVVVALAGGSLPR